MSTSLTIYSLVSPQWYIHIWTSPQEHLCVVSVEGGRECQCHTLNHSLGHWVIPSQTGSGPKQNYRQTGQHSFSHVFLPQCYKSLKWISCRLLVWKHLRKRRRMISPTSELIPCVGWATDEHVNTRDVLLPRMSFWSEQCTSNVWVVSYHSCFISCLFSAFILFKGDD